MDFNFAELVRETEDQLDTIDPAVIAESIYEEIPEEMWMQLLVSAVGQNQTIRRNIVFNNRIEDTPANTKKPKANLTNTVATLIRESWPDQIVPIRGIRKRVRDLTIEDLEWKIEEYNSKIAGLVTGKNQFTKVLDAMKKEKVSTVGDLPDTILNDEKYLQ